MNLNLLTIDALSTTPAQPLRRMAGKADGLGEDSTQLAFGMEDAAANKQSKRLTAASSTNVEDTPQSYNTDIATQAADKEVSNRGFENVLKQRLVLDESGDESGNEEVTANPKESVADDEKEQAFTLTEFQSVPCALAGTGNLSSAAAQTMDTQQEQQQSEALPSINTGQTNGNNAVASPNTVKMNVAENPPRAESDKPVESANQNNRGVDAQSIDLSIQSGAVQSETAALSAVTVTDRKDVRQAVESAAALGSKAARPAAGGRPGGEATASDRIKDKPGGDHTSTSSVESQKGFQDLSQASTDSGQDAGRLTEKLSVEKIDLLSVKTSTPKPEPAGGTSQSTAGQISVLDASQVAAGSRSAVADHSAATASNGSTSDTAAAIREQVCQSVQASIQQGNSQITIHLNPPELGRVSVKFSERGNELTGQLEVTNSQTRAEIQQAIPEIIRSLQESGISVKSIDVTLSDSSRQPAQESFRDNSSQDIWQQFGSQGFQGTGGNQFSPDLFVTPTYSENGSAVHNDTSFTQNQSLPSNNLLDVLI
jgi:flagellar hook-length control protein FliK